MLLISGLLFTAVFMAATFGIFMKSGSAQTAPPIQSQLTDLLAPTAMPSPASSTTPKQGVEAQPTQAKFGTFDFSDTVHSMSARVYLPLSVGHWAIENPWRDASKSLLKSPKLFATAMFQSVSTPEFNGFIRTIPDLGGVDCATAFATLDKANGMTILKYSDSNISGSADGKVYVFELEEKSSKYVIGEKILCNAKMAMSIFVAAPNDAKFTEPVNDILKNVTLRIPGLENE